MERPESISDEDGEPRRSPRHRTFLGATIVHSAEMHTIPCTIRDWSDKGVKVELPPMALLPLRFWLIDHRIDLAHEVRLTWRRGNFAGLELIDCRELNLSTDPQTRILRRVWLEKVPRAAAEGTDP
jgi:hypothetical protein